MSKRIIAIVMVIGLANAAQAGVWLDVDMHVNSIGQDVYIVTANSDGSPITSLGVYVQGDGNLGQVHPGGQITPMQSSNMFFAAVGAEIDWDTQAMFNLQQDFCPIDIACGPYGIDTIDILDWNGTGFTPFTTREVVQIVLTGGEATVMIGMVAGGVEYTLTPYSQGTISTLVPEPGSLGLLMIGVGAVLRRRKLES